MFTESFKYFKRKSPLPDFSSVIDLDSKPSTAEVRRIDLSSQDIIEHFPGLEPAKKWLCFALSSSGIIVIRNPFTLQGKRYWISRCVQDYPRHPNINNLNPHLFPNDVLKDWWCALQKCSDPDEVRRMSISMRWSTLGYHHDWDSKKYAEEKHGEFPKDLASLSAYFANALGFQDYEAQAAIVNFYPIGTTLSAHTDHSEPNRTAPLFSISFGQTAIFLIGGKTKEVTPLAIYLRSGDVLVMSGESRLFYHAVPRVMKARDEPWNNLVPTTTAKTSHPPSCKKPKIGPEFVTEKNAFGIDTLLYQKVADESYWSPFKKYLNFSRININVRQVLNKDQTCLPTLESLETIVDGDKKILSNCAR
ncbi:PREDICTED: DNA demethylase ALKBH1 isoform X1 [Rhagoletis zephyria]|uniref:DNA demethylase ALKBH1 isoform X1 n=1 Tax=Rhagoletis zephyria TaxID=28612 RepID=UPI0008115222|nr:PREDICTED: DNA demethylase ALKBH1 isoform X1 [Rhagoletis zephyria]